MQRITDQATVTGAQTPKLEAKPTLNFDHLRRRAMSVASLEAVTGEEVSCLISIHLEACV
jgi:hypothetical protein